MWQKMKRMLLRMKAQCRRWTHKPPEMTPQQMQALIEVNLLEINLDLLKALHPRDVPENHDVTGWKAMA